jgi:hypothetical protein
MTRDDCVCLKESGITPCPFNGCRKFRCSIRAPLKHRSTINVCHDPAVSLLSCQQLVAMLAGNFNSILWQYSVDT